jgi:hypothetical protein
MASSASTRASSRPKARWRDRAIGGMKESGIEEFLEVKYLCMGGTDG